ncbi:hypothetical protein AURDEDRAFT_111975 [Auricularia subglabra TFB-10046 SS5]|nr:hypothetical protein AURDEDRAFT_111975 [Auricularia subglabra TFB-10046 SS5]
MAVFVSNLKRAAEEEANVDSKRRKTTNLVHDLPEKPFIPDTAEAHRLEKVCGPMAPPPLLPPPTSRPTAPETYWPENAAYAPPVGWDAMAAARIMQHFRSLAVRCFDSLTYEEIKILIDSLPPHAKQQPGGGSLSGSDADAGSGANAGTDDGGGGSGGGGESSHGAVSDSAGAAGDGGASSHGATSDSTGGQGSTSRASVGTVFLLSVLLLSSRYADDDRDDTDDVDDDESQSQDAADLVTPPLRQGPLSPHVASGGNGDVPTVHSPPQVLWPDDDGDALRRKVDARGVHNPPPPHHDSLL